MEKDEAIRSWLDSAQENWNLANELTRSTQHYRHALFFAQLTLEKILKALHYCRKEDYPDLIHDLARLAKKAGLEIDEKTEVDLKEISSFNTATRYDDYKRKFYEKATPKFVEKWMKKAGEFRDYYLSQIKI